MIVMALLISGSLPTARRDPMRRRPDELKKHLNRLEALSSHELVSNALKLDSPIQMEGHLVFQDPGWDSPGITPKARFFG